MFEVESESREEIASVIIDKTYDTSFIKTFKKIKEADYIRKSRILWSTTDFLENMQKYLLSYKAKPVRVFVPRSNEYKWEVVIALTDLHLGKRGTTTIIERLEAIVGDIIEKQIDKVHIFCLWDLVETLVQWWMHDWQIETMEGVYGYDLLMAAVTVFENFITLIIENGIAVDFYWLSGNHDRMTKDRDWDKNRLWGLIIYELIKRGLANLEWFKIDIVQDYIKTVDIGSIRYIVAHGDMASMTKRKWSDIAWIHWDNTKSHNVIMYWHLHNITIAEEKSITKIGLPGLAWTDQYATKELDLHSEPAYITLTHNSYWSVDVSLKRLQSDDTI